MPKNHSARWVEDPEEMRIFQQERLVVEITELMCKTMKERDIKRGELAKQLNKSKGRISQILNGETNLTLHTVSDVFHALGKTLVVKAEDLFIERPLLQYVEQVFATSPYTSAWEIEGPSAKPCDNLSMSG